MTEVAHILGPDWLLEQGSPVGREDHPYRDLIAAAIDELGPGDREVLNAWAYERITYREIAERLGLAHRQSGQYRVRAALSRLRAILEEKGVSYD